MKNEKNIKTWMIEGYIGYLKEQQNQLKRILKLMSFYLKPKQIAHLFNAEQTLKEIQRELKEIIIIRGNIK